MRLTEVAVRMDCSPRLRHFARTQADIIKSAGCKKSRIWPAMPWWSSTPAPAPGPTSVQAEVVAVLPSPPEEARPPPPPPGPTPPRIPERFSVLGNLSVAELQQRQANGSAVDDLILEESAVKDLAKELSTIRQEGSDIADAIVSREPRVAEASADYEAATQAVEVLRSSVQAKLQQRSEILQRRSPHQLGLRLNAKAQEAEHLAEETLNQALDGGAMDAAGLSQFRQQFLQQKMNKHLHIALKAALESGA
ncbi:unnamed protein product [Durusdinium trenchii]|uniref:VPS37 C-terminal domain-containing protein n=2 Tax=Durusdinium trenchii TaxID=1381693 RepID=A0ABP0K2Y3_9DINO